jgi:hypothetical protein
MSMLLEEAVITCPWCWESIDMLIDLSAGSQCYIEDCQVCCNPIEISVESTAGELHALDAVRSE